MAKYSDMLVFLRKRAKLSQQELADKLKMTRSAISMYETGKREPDLETFEAFADFYNVDMNTLTGKPAPIIPACKNIEPMPRMDAVPLVGTIACGDPILAEENVEDYVGMPEHVRADFALRCKGDSMINARIYDGDIVYIRQDAYVDNGDIAAVLIDSEATLKRVYRNEGSVVLQPENPAYAPMVFTGADMENIRILGKAVAFTSVIK